MSDSVSSDLQESTFDWEGAHRRIAAVEAVLAGVGETTPETKERIWARRAAQLAKAPVEEDIGERVALLVVRMGREVYGIDVQHVRDIRSAGQVTPVPRVPDWVVGVVNLRGHILSVIDLPSFFGLARDGRNGNGNGNGTEGPYLVVVEVFEMEVALLVDEVMAVETFSAGRMLGASDTIRGITPEYVHGVIDSSEGDAPSGMGLLVVLNLPGVLSDERLIIHEEIA
jgi:purine-binding chemotaxis protein CheW